jgi:hypothetical protein
VLPQDAGKEALVEVSRVFGRPDPPRLREFADDIRDGKFVLPISRRMPLRDAGAAHDLLEKAGVGRSCSQCNVREPSHLMSGRRIVGHERVSEGEEWQSGWKRRIVR